MLAKCRIPCQYHISTSNLVEEFTLILLCTEGEGLRLGVSRGETMIYPYASEKETACHTRKWRS